MTEKPGPRAGFFCARMCATSVGGEPTLSGATRCAPRRGMTLAGDAARLIESGLAQVRQQQGVRVCQRVNDAVAQRAQVVIGVHQVGYLDRGHARADRGTDAGR